jgi:alpha-glucosidase
LYSINLNGDPTISPSQVDLKVEGVGWLTRQSSGIKATTDSKTETVRFTVPPKYRERYVSYNELALVFENASRLVFRAYDDGIAYRWETHFANAIKIADEKAEFRSPGKPRAWFPEEESMFSHQEPAYKNVSLADVGSDRFCSTGVLIDVANGRKVFISESNLRSYPGMFLRGVGNNESGLVGKFAGFPLETPFIPIPCQV